MAPFALVLLGEEPAHGYALTGRLKQMGVAEGELDVRQVYKTLECLERLGHVRSEWRTERPGPPRRRYELTAAGREALDEWSAVMAERRRLIDEFETRHLRLEEANMMSGAVTTHEEHEVFRAHITQLEGLADRIGEIPTDELTREATEAHEFLAHTVMPHAVAEGVVVFPLVREESGEPTIGVRMTQCHVQLSRLVDELETEIAALERGGAATQRAMRRTLYGIATVLTAHLAEQDEQVEPLLEANLPAEDREALFAAVERCAKEVAAQYE
jgi:DNA-binding PadR family transcriptional regulator